MPETLSYIVLYPIVCRLQKYEMLSKMKIRIGFVLV